MLMLGFNLLFGFLNYRIVVATANPKWLRALAFVNLSMCAIGAGKSLALVMA